MKKNRLKKCEPVWGLFCIQ